MADFYRPAFYKNGALHLLPRPVVTCDIEGGWKFDTEVVPFKDGTMTYAHSREAKTINLSGQIGFDENGLYITEAEMFARYEAIEDAIDVDGRPSLFELFIYHDTNSVGSYYRKFKRCVPVKFKLACGDSARNPFGWELSVLAEDPTMYRTGPGA